jgi:hypothetical protein
VIDDVDAVLGALFWMETVVLVGLAAYFAVKRRG